MNKAIAKFLKSHGAFADGMKNLVKPIYELKPCPFCGGKAEIIDVTWHIQNNLIAVKCSRCGASTKLFGENKKDNAIDFWNRRVVGSCD